jgi:hypothetical protein
MKVYLAMVFLVQGQWVDGATLDGWAPRQQPSMEICLDRARAAMTFAPPEGAERLVANCRVVRNGEVSSIGARRGLAVRLQSGANIRGPIRQPRSDRLPD